MLFNQYDIEHAAKRSYNNCPNVCKGYKLLLALVNAVNAQSDGWAYWKAPSKACKKLQELLVTAGRYGTITDVELKKAITPIRTMVSRQTKIQAKYGNKFEFSVDANLILPNG